MKNRELMDPPPVSSARVPNAKQPRWRAEKSTALAIRLQLAKNEHDESASSSKARENFAIFVTNRPRCKLGCEGIVSFGVKRTWRRRRLLTQSGHKQLSQDLGATADISCRYPLPPVLPWCAGASQDSGQFEDAEACEGFRYGIFLELFSLRASGAGGYAVIP